MRNNVSVPAMIVLHPALCRPIRVEYNGCAFPSEVEIEMGQPPGWEDKNVSQLQVKAEARLVQAKLSPGKLTKGKHQAETLVLVSVCPGAGVEVDHESPEGIAGGGSAER